LFVILALNYGADLVYSPEIIDKRLLKSKRIVNEALGTIDFIDDTDTLNLRVHPSETSKLVVQIGSADPELAVQAALVVQNDVAAVDLNCGCPKKFSVSGGMGSALLENPQLLTNVYFVLT
jgi:tRNA-dihydrouridine synthase 2